MTLLVHGCSLSSGWGFTDLDLTWPNLVANEIDTDLHNLAQTSASNHDIFLSAVRHQDLDYDIRLIQWTSLNRITVSPNPLDSHVILSVHDQYLKDALPGVTHSEIHTFVRILTLLNQDWKMYFDLITMIEILQKDPRTYFINGLLPWDMQFFQKAWHIPLLEANGFLQNLLQSDSYSDDQLEILLHKVLEARNKIDVSRWINLAPSWNSDKVDTVSDTDSHPGPLSQIKYAQQVCQYILV